MTVNMRHALSSRRAILDCNIERFGIVDPFQCPLDASDSVEEVGYLIFREIGKVWLYTNGRDQDVAWEQRLEVDYGEGEWREVEDLP